jgi:hypothetical protein
VGGGGVVDNGKIKTSRGQIGKNMNYVALSNKDILQAISMAPIHIEVSILRLKWYATLARRPHHHKLFLAALLGEMVCRPEQKPTEHPHAQQLLNDVKLFCYIEDLAEHTGEVLNNPMILFSDTIVSKIFVNTDLSMIRQRFLKLEFPPPSFLLTPPINDRLVVNPEKFMCF